MKIYSRNKSPLLMPKHRKISPSRLILLAALVFLLLLLWPSFVTAVPLTTHQQFNQVWQNAQDIGRYQFFVTALQTAHPTLRIENVGRGPEQTLLTADGLVNVPEDQMELNLWSEGRPLMIQLLDGSAYGRADVNDDWVELEDPDMIFAPGNNVMGFASAAVNIQEVENWQESMELDAVTAVRTAATTTLYTFDLSGPLFAEYMRQQAEIKMRRDGELLPGMELGLAQQYVDMTGQGQLWINAQGLPVYQVLHLEFPPARGAMERVDADITTEFAGWGNPTLVGSTVTAVSGSVGHALSFLPQLQLPTAESLSVWMMNFALLLALVVFFMVLITYRRSPKLYATIALLIILSMVSTPLFQVAQAQALSERQTAALAEQEAAQAEQTALDELRHGDNNFNPTIDPLAQSAVAPTAFVGPSSKSNLPRLALQTTCDLNDSEGDCDDDGLSNGIELFRLGTDPEDIDSDGDKISDATEVQGFDNGTQWYMNPLDSDTNNDGLIDLVECFERIDVAPDGTFNGTDVSAIDCPDTDGDGAPDVFDFDNDGDGVPDGADMSPNFTGDMVDNPQDVLDINLAGYTTDATLLVEYQIRPENAAQLWQTGNSFLWPHDKQGQVTFVHDREVTMTPMLEITIPAPASNSSNIVGSLPIVPTKTINDISPNDTVDTWLDTETLAKYGINVTQSSDDGSLLAYVPLTVVNDPIGDMAVAWSGSMVYRPEVANWGQNHEARVVWFISGKTSYCDVSDMPNVVTFQNRQGETIEVIEDKRRYEVWCEQSENWVANADSSVLQVYDEPFTVVGMKFTEYNGVDTAVIAQTDALSVAYEDDLWRLTNGLYQSFAQGKVFGANQDRFDIAEVKNRFDNDTAAPYANGADELWGIDNGSFNILVSSSPDLISALDAIGKEHIPQLLSDTYSTPSADDVVNIITLREQTTRSTSIEDNTAVTLANGTVSVDLSDQDSALRGSIQWGPYHYDGVDWDPADIINYVDVTLEDQLDVTLQDSHITAILDPGESIQNVTNARAGILSLASSYYIGVYQGATSTLESNGQLVVDTSSGNEDDYLVNDAALNLGINPAFVAVSNETLLFFQDFIAEELFTEIDNEIVAGPIAGYPLKIAILEVFGSAKNGTAEGDDIGVTLIKGSKGVLNKVASEFEKRALKIEVESTGWQKRAKNLATALNVVNGVVGFVGPELGLSESAVIGIQLGLETASNIIATVDALKEVHGGVSSFKLGYIDDFWEVRRAAKSGAVLGLIIDATIIVGVAVYTILSQDLEPGSIAFNTVIAEAIGALVVAIISAVIGAIFPVGTVIMAVVALIDFLIGAICAIIDEVGDDGTIPDEVDKWVCGGISGAIAAGITWAIYDNYLTVDLDADGLMTTSLNDLVVNAPNGYVPGASVQMSMDVVTKLTLAPIESGPIKNSFTTSQLRSKMRRSAFGYYLQPTATDHHDELHFGSVNWVNDQHTFHPSITFTFDRAGINQSRDVYFTQSYNVVMLECWGFIFTSSASCDEKPTRNSSHTKLDSLVFDIFPATFDDFIRRNYWGFQWLDWATVKDIDGDGLWGGYSDPDPNSPDKDGDGLTDRWELENGTDSRQADRDNDGLSDYWEVVYGTNPFQKDSDGDSLLDGEEFPHSQAINPFVEDTQPWTGGWLLAYDYDASDNPLNTWIRADAFSADSDDDGLPDTTERFYGYNPNVANTINPVSLVSSFATNSAQAGVVGVQETIAYTATVGNEDQANTIEGQFNVEVPEDFPQVTETIPTLVPDETITFSGASSVGDITASQYTNVTIRAQVALAGWVDDVSGNALLRFPLDENVATGFVANTGTLGGQATCDPTLETDQVGGCPLFGDKGQVLEAANFNLRRGKEINYPFAAGLEQNTFSMGAWVKPYGGTDPKFMFGREQNSLSLMGDKVQFSISSNEYSTCSIPTVLTSNTRLRRHQWHHVMATYDGTTMRIYINGILDVNTAIHTEGVCSVVDNPFDIGQSSTSAGFRGLLDEIVFFGSALDQTQIDTLYNYQYYFFDAVQRYPIIVDAEGPENSLNLDTDLPNKPVLLGITSIDDFSLVHSVQVMITSPGGNIEVLDAEQDESESGLWYFMFTPDLEGQYAIDINALDAVGNVGVEQTFIYVDDSPSVVTIDNTLISSAIKTNQESVTEDNKLLLFGSITDNRTLGDNVAIDVQDWLSTTVQAIQLADIVTDTISTGTWGVDYLFPERAYGEYTVLASSEDFVGNQITETIGTIQIDDFGPWADVTMNTTDISGAGTIYGTVNEIPYDNSGRLFHLHLDEAASSTTFVDATLKKFVATCNNDTCPTAGVAGQYATAVQFDGSTDRLEIAADDIFSMTNGTLMAWVHPTWSASSNGYNPTLLAVDDGISTNFRWQLADDYNSIILVTDSGTASAPITINPNEWTHLALVMEGSAWTGFVNGIPTTSISQTLGLQSGLPFQIGAANENEGHFTGLIDEVVIYDHALSIDKIYDIAHPLDTTVAQLEIQTRHMNGAIWPGVDPDGLKMYLPLDDPQGVTDFSHTSLITQSVSCEDENGSCPLAGVEGAFGTAVSFDGDDYIEIPDTADLDFQQMTVSFWVKTDSSSFNDNLVTKGRDGWEINMHPIAGLGHIVFDTEGLVDINSNAWVLVSSVPVIDNEWHHVVALYDGTNKKIYIDGNLAGSQEVTGQLPASDQPLVIGANYEIYSVSTEDAFNGALDEVAIFNRALTEDEIQTLYTWETWQMVALDSPDSFYGTWTASIPTDLEGLYTVGLRATDSVGNVLANQTAWTGPVDLKGPRLMFEYTSLPDNYVQVYCSAVDLNITDASWVCPVGAPVSETRQASDWFVDYFSPITRTVGMASSVQTINTTEDGTMTACDLHGNCTTMTIPKTSSPEGVAILEPVNGTVLANFEPITIRGYAWSDQEIRQVNLMVNGSTIETFHWYTSQGATQSEWSATWTPPAGVHTFDLEARLLTGEYTGGTNPSAPGIVYDESETILHGPSLRVEASVFPTLVFPGELVTYTIVVANNGLNGLQDVVISDTLPVGVTPATAVAGINETVELGVGETITYTIPATVDAGQTDDIVNTVYVDHVTFDGQDSATLHICAENFVVTTSNATGTGSLQEALINVCDGGTISFATDMTISGAPFPNGFVIGKPVTIDGSGHTVQFEVTYSFASIFTVADGIGPVTLSNLQIVKEAAYSESGEIFIISNGVASDLTLVNMAMDIGNNDDHIIINQGEMTFVNSQVWGSVSTSDVFSNTGSLTFRNSTVDASVNNASGGMVIVDQSTLFAGERVENEWEIDPSSGFTNEGTVRLSSSILVSSGSDCTGSGTYIDLGYNLVANSGSCPIDSGITQTIDPALLFTTVLNPMADNGGNTQTYALIGGSPAIDAIPAESNDCGTTITTDQRELLRPQNGSCDMGAYEVQAYAPPVAVDDDVIGYEDLAVSINVLTNDNVADASAASVTSVTQPANGTAVIDDTLVVYTPTLNFNGSDSFSYTMGDSNGGSDTATVTVTVEAINDEPVAVDDQSSTAEDTAVSVDVLANDTDFDGDTLIVASITQGSHGTVVNNGSDVIYTPDPDFHGSDSFAYTVTDGNGRFDTATVAVTVSSVNDAPDAVADSVTTDEETAVTIDVLANDSDIDGDTLTVDSVTQPGNGTVVNNGSDVTYTPNLNFNGSDNFSYTISDGQGGFDTATVAVTISSVNDAPEAAADNAATDEETAVTIDVLANDSDIDGDTLTVDSVTQPGNGTVVNNSSDVTYTPNLNFNGSDNFTYTISDGQGGFDTATVAVTISSVNDMPEAAADSATTYEETAVIIDALANDNDVDGDALTITGVTQPVNGTVVNNGSDVTYTPANGFMGSDSFTYTISDGQGEFDTATVVVVVNSHLLAHWAFEEGSGNTTADTSRYGNHGTLSGQIAWSTYSESGTGYSLDFDGVNDYVTVPNESQFDLNVISVAFWVKVDTFTTNWQAMVTKGDSAWRIHRCNGNQTISFSTNGLSNVDMCSNTMFNDNRWHHVVAIFDGSTKYLYVDGTLDNSLAVTGSLSTNNYPVRIGNNAQTSSRYFNGQMDDVQIYDKALSAEEIALLAVAPPEGVWLFEEGSGATAVDTTGNGHDGALSSGVVWTNGTPFGTGHALHFDGVDDFVTIADNDTIDFTKDQDFTVALWVKADPNQPDNDGIDNMIVEKWSGGGVGYPFVIRYMNQTHANAGSIRVARYDGSNNPAITSSTAIDDGQYHHILFSKQGNMLYLYIDGVLDSTTVDTTTGTTTNSSALFLGKRGNNRNYFKGDLDDLRIYDRALTTEEISLLAVAPPESVWLFDEGSGTTAVDTTGNGYDGTLIGNVTWTVATPSGTGYALNFDGVDGYASLPYVVDPGVDQFTAIVWFKVTDYASQRYILQQTNGSGMGRSWLYVATNGKLGTYLGGSALFVDTPVTTGEWHQATVTYDGTTLSLYLDGELATQERSLEASDGDMLVGANKNLALIFAGSIDNVVMYDQALSSEEIQTLVDAGG